MHPGPITHHIPVFLWTIYCKKAQLSSSKHLNYSFQTAGMTRWHRFGFIALPLALHCWPVPHPPGEERLARTRPPGCIVSRVTARWSRNGAVPPTTCSRIKKECRMCCHFVPSLVFSLVLCFDGYVRYVQKVRHLEPTRWFDEFKFRCKLFMFS